MAYRVLVYVSNLLILQSTIALIVPNPINLPIRAPNESEAQRSNAKLIGLEIGRSNSVKTSDFVRGLYRNVEESVGKRNIVGFTGKCSKYCGNSGDEESFQYISLIWSNDDVDLRDGFVSTNQGRIVLTRNTGGQLDNCQVYLDIDCDLEGNRSERTNGNFEKLVEKYELRGYTLQKFSINRSVTSVLVNIGGNLSRATLQIPKMWRTRITMSVRKTDGNGVEIYVRAAPPGEWLMKLESMENSKYYFRVEESKSEHMRKNMFIDLMGRPNAEHNGDEMEHQINEEQTANTDNFKIASTTLMNESNVWDTISEVKSRTNRKVYFERLVQGPFSERDQTILQRPTDTVSEPIITYDSNNSFVTINDPANYNGDSGNFTFITKGYRDTQGRTSIASLEDFATTYSNTTSKLADDISSRMVELADDPELSGELARYADKEATDMKRMLIEVNRNSNLLVTPGTIHRVVFDVMNGCILPVRYAFQAKSSSFRVYSLQPVYAWIYPGRTSQVAVDLVIPNTVGPDSTNTLSLSIVGTEIKEKSVYLYAQGSSSRGRDDVPPTLEYSFNNNCGGKLDKNHCNKSRWSADITIRDYDSGLKRVVATPNNIYPRTDFISGTREPVTFYYTSTCCDTSARITAIDLYNNYDSRTIDVTIWNNLSEAEIAAITVGALFILLLIILVILLVVYCFRRKKSHDLPYTQRYGSRAAPQPERTSF